MKQINFAREKIKRTIKEKIKILEKEIIILKHSLHNKIDNVGLALLLYKRKELAFLIRLKYDVQNCLRTKFN
jgi:hypothetical protein